MKHEEGGKDMAGVRLTQALHRNAELFGDKPATIMAGRTTDWQSLYDDVASLAAGLLSSGAQSGDRIAILSLNSDAYIKALYATLWAGCVAVPLNTRWSAAELQYALGDSGAAFLFHDAHFAAIANDLGLPRNRLIAMEEGAEDGSQSVALLIEANAPSPDLTGRDDDLAMIFYTGGTTGRSKGVMLSHDNLVGNFLSQHALVRYPLDSVFLHAAPMFHIADACCLVGMMTLGATQVIIPAFDPHKVMQVIEDQSVSATLLVPTMIAMLVEAAQNEGRTIDGIRNILYGASPISEAVLTAALRTFPNAQFSQAYGQTEASPIITVLDHEDHLAGKLRSAGRPLLGIDMRIVDPHMNDVKTGEIGEVCARGPNVMLGYWDKPELTEQTIVDGWLRTGDAGYRDDKGYLYLVDRMKDMIITGGENVYSVEVENALMTHPAVMQCAVIGIADEIWGEAVHAVVQLRKDASPSEEELRAHCQDLIAGYKCPRSFTFQMEPLPLSGAGKILKTELRKAWQQANEATAG